MSGKCLLISSCVVFLILTTYVALVLKKGWFDVCVHQCIHSSATNESGILTIQSVAGSVDKGVRCYLTEFKKRFKSPSLESFIQALVAEENQERSSISGLAVYSRLTNACKPLDDVSKAKIQVYKFALVTLVDKATCPLQDLVVNAQNAGYTALVYFGDATLDLINATNKDKLLIPVLFAEICEWTSTSQSSAKTVPGLVYVDNHDLMLSDADRTKIDIRVPLLEGRDGLGKIGWYLKYLPFWFLVGPLITYLEWMRRTASKESGCWMQSGGQQVDKNQVVGNYTVYTITFDEEQEQSSFISFARIALVRYFFLLCYLIPLIIVPLPVGISTGGLSFFRFDQGDNIFPKTYFFNLSEDTRFLNRFVTLWWSPFQVFCFFIYSLFVCKTTWTIPTNYPKVIRSDWFSSNMYLSFLSMVVPYCQAYDPYMNAPYFATHNIICTVSNVLFIIILNKHKVVTLSILYISICAICAYIESDIVAVYCFALNSTGSLINLKLTVLRALAINLTLSASISSSLHVIRKLSEPQESLFE